jgi:serine/tyrosine/threonine adenylyltransferase
VTALHAIGVPTTRALSLSLLRNTKVVRERIEPGAIVARFAETWLRIGSFDILHARRDRPLLRKLATFIAEEVFQGWKSLPGISLAGTDDPATGIPRDGIQGGDGAEENRFAKLYREIVLRNAKTVAAWQAYGFMNGVLNTDNTSIYGLSLDYGPFAFMDNFDPQYTPNHDDHLLRYSYKNQPSVIWWNLVRLGESLGELIGAGDQVDDDTFVTKGVTQEHAPILIKRAETIIERIGEEYRSCFLNEYRRLMSRRVGLKKYTELDSKELLPELLDTLEALELDYNHFFRKLSQVSLGEVETKAGRRSTARIFFHSEGVGGVGNTEDSAEDRIAKWLEKWRQRVIDDWSLQQDSQRQEAMKAVNPKVSATTSELQALAYYAIAHSP